MDKISQEDVLKIAEEAPAVIRKLAAERDELASKLAAVTLRHDVEKLAAQMHDKGLSTDVPMSMLVDQLEAQAMQGKLAEIQRAVDLVGPDMGQKIAHIRETHNNDDPNVAGGTGELVAYLLS